MKSFKHLAVAASLGAMALAAPLPLDPSPFATSPAFAKDHGGGNGGGGGGNGGDRGGGRDNAARGDDRGQDRANQGRGNDRSETAKSDRGHGKDTGRAEDSNKHHSVAGALGGLNAAHASPNARENASANSKVGQIAAYEKQMLEAQAIKDPAQRAAAQAEARMTLERAANKPVSDDVVARVNEMLGLEPAKP